MHPIRLLLLCLLPCYIAAQSPISNAHAHNDYQQKVPLFDALQNGFTSIEVDVYSHQNQIKVSHLKRRLRSKPTLEELYLLPLKKWIAKNGGTVFPGDSTPLILMIDLKKDKGTLYHLLKKQLAGYEQLLEVAQGPKAKWGPLKILLSGRPPMDSILQSGANFFAVDGYLADLRPQLDFSIRPRASANFNHWAKWHRKKGMTAEDQLILKTMIQKAQNQGIETRFWATPDDPALWQLLLDLGVDWINVDDLEAFKRFMENR